VGFSYKKQQRCEIFVGLPIWAIYKGAAHRNIKICYGALHLRTNILTFFATNIAVRCTFKFYKKTLIEYISKFANAVNQTHLIVR
jgi:hypothetical protein